MGGSKVLVLGGTGPAGICLLRELLHRKHQTIAFARTPSKIPADLIDNPDLEVIQGEMDNHEALSLAISKSNIILSLLGPNSLNIPSGTFFPDFYRTVFSLMREHHVSRIYAMGTISIPNAKDRFSLLRSLVVWLVYLAANTAYQNIIGIGKAFEEDAKGLDWTIFRIASIPGGADEVSWKEGREQEVVAGWVADETWCISTKRGALAKWLVDSAEGDGKEWVGQMPAISARATKGFLSNLVTFGESAKKDV